VEILVLHPGALGDIILSLPAMELLRGRFPAARITLAGNLDYLTAVAQGHAHQFVSLSAIPLHALYRADPLRPDQENFWKAFDLVLSWTGSGDPEFVQKLQRLHSNAHIAAWKPLPGTKIHASQRFLESLSPWIKVRNRERPAAVFLSPENRTKAVDWLRSKGCVRGETLVALHAGAGSEAKRWPIANYRELARLLLETANNKLVIIEGPAETGLGAELSQALPASVCVMARDIPLELLAGILEQCAAFVGNDSGIAHLAAALKTRTLVLFGPTLPENWAPLGENVVALRNAEACPACRESLIGAQHICLKGISVAAVRELLRQWEV
jgi:ADP-heptose:LPS heptosyltransferase